jgi:hypothetical protein
MRRLILVAAMVWGLAGCGIWNARISASGPLFSAVPQSPLAVGQARIFVLRDKVLYLAQGPGIGRREVAIDGRVIGYLEDGGFLMDDVSAGLHSVSIGVGGAQTTRGFAVEPGEEAFINVDDKSRMMGARALATGAVGGAIGGITQTLQEQEEAAEGHEGPIWRIEQIPPADGMAILQNLALSQ